jgi:hypothetical protein
MNKYLKVRKSAQATHFRRRAFERLGFHLTDEEVSNIRSSIEKQEAALLARQSLRHSIWRCYVGKRDIIVVYDEETDEPATIITESMWQERSVCNSPTVENAESLQTALGDHPGAKVLKELRKKDRNG